MVLASLLDRELQSGRLERNLETLVGMLKLFSDAGGFRPFLESRRGAKRILHWIRKAGRDLKFVYGISDYLVRCKKSQIAEGKSTIEYAKQFVRKNNSSITLRTIGKIWETNKQSAPYVFAFYHLYSMALEPATSIDQLVMALEGVARSQKQVNQLLGEAAFTADILVGKARDVRLGDFKDVERVGPRLDPFSTAELQIIDEIDPDELSEKDSSDYRPKVVPKT